MMTVCVVFSTKDVASMNIFNNITSITEFEPTGYPFDGFEVLKHGKVELLRTNEQLVFFERINSLDYDEFIFASKHSSQSKKPTLTVHACGNFGPADLGGKPNTLSNANALRMLSLYKGLIEKQLSGFEVSLEVTHHGPFVEKPHAWIEIGSSIEQWENEKVGGTVAEVILNSLKKPLPTAPVVIGIGGGHYAVKFSEMEGGYAFGHIMPKYAQNYFNKDILEQMINKTISKPERIIIEKKGVKAQQELREKISKWTELEIVTV